MKALFLIITFLLISCGEAPLRDAELGGFTQDAPAAPSDTGNVTIRLNIN